MLNRDRFITRLHTFRTCVLFATPLQLQLAPAPSLRPGPPSTLCSNFKEFGRTPGPP